MSSKYESKEYSAQQRKDYYLSNLVDWMANDEKFDRIFSNFPDEMERDGRILKYLLESGKYHLNRTEKELQSAAQKARVTSGKCLYLSQKHQRKAHFNCELDDYQEAANDYSKAIVYQPLNKEDDYIQLANIYQNRARCFIRIDDHEAAAIDYEFAMIADKTFTLSAMTRIEKELHAKFKDKIMKIFSHIDQPMFEINDCIGIFFEDDQMPKMYGWSHTLEPNQIILSEQSICKFQTSTFDNCYNCDRYIRNFQYWPCKYCTTIVYCCKKCCDDDFQYHQFECGLIHYIRQLPIMILILRFYFRTKTSPLTSYVRNQNYIEDFILSVQQHQQYEKTNLLNVFRQAIDHYDKNRSKLMQNKHHYYAALIMAIELAYIYDICIHNSKLRMYDRIKYVPSKLQTFDWLSKSVQVNDFIVKLFIDLKRFMISPFAKFEIAPKNFRQNYRRERRIPLLISCLFPEQSVSQTNLEAILNDSNGRIEIRNDREIIKNQRSFSLFKYMRIINTNVDIINDAPSTIFFKKFDF